MEMPDSMLHLAKPENHPACLTATALPTLLLAHAAITAIRTGAAVLGGLQPSTAYVMAVS